jgi:hypothetical protein
VQFFALDVWNGGLAQAQSFVSDAQITYPLLRNAGAVTNSYAGGYEYVYVIGGDNRVVYRNLSGWNDAEVTAAVQSALDDLQGTPAPPSRVGSVRLPAPEPNPFNPRTTLTLELDQASAVASLSVFDQRGRRVRSLLESQTVDGPRFTVSWDGLDDRGMPLPSGVYFFRLDAGGSVDVVKGALVR